MRLGEPVSESAQGRRGRKKGGREEGEKEREGMDGDEDGGRG